jgi:hypothetical protein
MNQKVVGLDLMEKMAAYKKPSDTIPFSFENDQIIIPK